MVHFGSRSTPAFIGAIAGVLLLLSTAGVEAQAAVALHWTKTDNGTYNGSDVGHGVAAAADGSIYVMGYTHVKKSQREDLLLQKHR